MEKLLERINLKCFTERQIVCMIVEAVTFPHKWCETGHFNISLYSCFMQCFIYIFKIYGTQKYIWILTKVAAKSVGIINDQIQDYSLKTNMW